MAEWASATVPGTQRHVHGQVRREEEAPTKLVEPLESTSTEEKYAQ